LDVTLNVSLPIKETFTVVAVVGDALGSPTVQSYVPQLLAGAPPRFPQIVKPGVGRTFITIGTLTDGSETGTLTEPKLNATPPV
jgi:hypothetical protein